MKKIKWLLVGAGNIAQRKVVPGMLESGNSELFAVCDLDKEKAALFGTKYIYTDFEAALCNPEIEAVYLATPVSLHVSQGISALETGRHIIVEKPLGLNSELSRKLLETVRKSGKKAGCAFYRRMTEHYRLTKELLDSESIGEFTGAYFMYAVNFNPPPETPAHWRVVKSRAGGGVLCDLGSHIFDIVINLLGKPNSVMASCGTLTPGHDVEDHASVLLKMPNGATVTTMFNWNSEHLKAHHEAVFWGRNGKIHWPNWPPHDNCAPIIFWNEHEHGREITTTPAPVNFHTRLIRDFADAVLNDRAPQCTADDGMRVNILTDTIYRAASSGREEKINWRLETI